MNSYECRDDCVILSVPQRDIRSIEQFLLLTVPMELAGKNLKQLPRHSIRGHDEIHSSRFSTFTRISDEICLSRRSQSYSSLDSDMFSVVSYILLQQYSRRISEIPLDRCYVRGPSEASSICTKELRSLGHNRKQPSSRCQGRVLGWSLGLVSSALFDRTLLTNIRLRTKTHIYAEKKVES